MNVSIKNNMVIISSAENPILLLKEEDAKILNQKLTKIFNPQSVQYVKPFEYDITPIVVSYDFIPTLDEVK